MTGEKGNGKGMVQFVAANPGSVAVNTAAWSRIERKLSLLQTEAMRQAQGIYQYTGESVGMERERVEAAMMSSWLGKHVTIQMETKVEGGNNRQKMTKYLEKAGKCLFTRFTVATYRPRLVK